MNSPRKLIWLLIAGLVFGVAAYGWAYFRSFQTLQITFTTKNAGLKASVYHTVLSNHETSNQAIANPSNLAQSLSQDGTIKLKKGDYLIASSGNTDYEIQYTEITLSNKAESITINPNYTTKKLTNLLAEQKTDLQQAIQAAVPQASSYRVADGKLYAHGEWYGTSLSANLTDAQRRLTYLDFYHLVAHKESGVWKVLTLPPELVLSTVSYPSIPRDVLVDVNDLH